MVSDIQLNSRVINPDNEKFRGKKSDFFSNKKVGRRRRFHYFLKLEKSWEKRQGLSVTYSWSDE